MSTAQLDRPAGAVVHRLVRNLRPGQWIWPPEWAQDDPDRRWALVIRTAVIWTLTGDQGRVATVQCMWPDGSPLKLSDRPSVESRVIVPSREYLNPIQHEVTLLSGDHPRFPGLGMASVGALPEQGPQVALRYVETAVDDGRVVDTSRADLRVEVANAVTGRRLYRLAPSPDATYFTAHQVEYPGGAL